MLKVAALTPGKQIPSARFRVRQHTRVLLAQDILLREFIAPLGAYPPRRRWSRPLWGLGTLAANAPRIAATWRYDVCLLQRELVSTFATLEFLTRSPRVLDVDDAIFLYRNGDPARRLARLCRRVICGNAFLAEWFNRWNRDVVVIPTAIDTSVYTPGPKQNRESVVIGWIGTSGNLPYLERLQGALRVVLEECSITSLLVVSDRAPQLPKLPPDRIRYQPWGPDSEVSAIQSMDIGIMPLEDSAWSRGKCSFKMLQYMACGLPVVASPVGMNGEVLDMGQIGFGPTRDRDWSSALIELARTELLRLRLGSEGRHIVQRSFSIDVIAPQLARALRNL